MMIHQACLHLVWVINKLLFNWLSTFSEARDTVLGLARLGIFILYGTCKMWLLNLWYRDVIIKCHHGFCRVFFNERFYYRYGRSFGEREKGDYLVDFHHGAFSLLHGLQVLLYLFYSSHYVRWLGGHLEVVKEIRICHKLLEIQEELVKPFLNVTLWEEDCVNALQAQIEECLLFSLPAMIVDHVIDPLDDLFILS